MKTANNQSIFKNAEELIQLVKYNNLLRMITLAEKQLNPFNYQLSFEAKKRLRWLHLLYYEQDGNVTLSAKKIGITREWLCKLKNKFKRSSKDPRVLEPKSKAPHNRDNRNRISKDVEKKILKIRDESENIWGKVKIAVALKRDYEIKINPNTVNTYLHKNKRINPKISLKNSKSWKAKVAREKMDVELRVKYRPPKEIKDYAPGTLVEKDMKYVPKYKQEAPGKAGENFFNQHTEISHLQELDP